MTDRSEVTTIRLDGAAKRVQEPWYPDPFTIVETQVRDRRSSAGEGSGGAAWEFQLERLPYCLGGAFWTLIETAELISAALANHEPDFAHDEVTQVVVEAVDVFRIRHHIDSYLEVSCRAQDALVGVLSVALSKSLPSSLSGCMRELRKRALPLPRELTEVLSQYWAQSGSALRKYRDLAQHHAIVASEATFVRSADGNIGLALSLPGNPSVKKPHEWRYGDHGEPAYSFCERAFNDMHECIYRSLYLVAQRLKRPQLFTQMITARAPIGPGTPRAEQLRIPQELANDIRKRRRQLADECEAACGLILDSA